LAKKKQIKETMEVLLETFPKLKLDIIEEIPFDIRKEKNGWICFIRTKYNQFEQYGLITTVFDSEGNPKEMSKIDLGRGQKVYISKDENGKYIASEN
jgi:hypothetical protein